MRTPSIERRFVTVGIAVVAVIVLAFDLFAFFSARARATADADKVFNAQAAVVKAEAAFVGAPGLAERLGSIGIKAVVIAPDGTRVESNPAAPPGSGGRFGASTPPDVPLTLREVRVERGIRVLVASPSAARDPRVSQVLALEAAITPLALVLSALLLRWIAMIATKPLDEIAARARLTTKGQPGERLHPDRPETRLGQMATAYDNMLDSLEGAVAEARAARAESDRLERRTSKILETAHEAFLVMDSRGAIIEWNPGAERIFGWSREEIVGRRWEDTLIPDDLRRRLEADRAANGGHLWPLGTRTAELEAMRKDGRRFPAGVTVWATNHDGVCTFNAFVSDFTERRRAEETKAQLDSSLEALAEAAEEARASAARTRRFLDDAAHQLRSPITSIRACADTLQRDITPDQRDRLLGAVCRESERASRLMAGLLRMARLGQEQARELAWTDVLALCEEEADRARLESPHLDIVARPLGPLGQARLAPDPIREILSNLVDNARRHARSRIDITAEARDAKIELRVRDDGPGLPEGQEEAVFERFVSLDQRGGSGLGLAIGRELARTHGGDLSYEERAFVLRVPCEMEPAPQPEAVAAPGRVTR